MIAAPPCPAPPLPQLAWASPSLFAASKPLSQHRQLAWAAKRNLSFYHTPRTFPQLSLSIPPKRNNEFRKQHQQQLQQLCLSAFSPPPQIKTNNNNKSRFTLSLALPNSNYDDNSHIIHQHHEEEEEEIEEEPTASSALQIQQKVLALCTSISTIEALGRYVYVAEEHGKIFNGPSELSPRCDGESLKNHFCDGMLWNLLGTGLAILVMRSSCYALKRYQELGYTNFLSILKSFTPGSLVVALEVWPFQVRSQTRGIF